MSLNRLEQTLFSYWGKHPDELRHWQSKVADLTRYTSYAEQLYLRLARQSLFDLAANRRR